MAKKVTYVSDITDKEIEDHVHVTIERTGYLTKMVDTIYAGPVTLDVDESDLEYIPKLVTFQKNEIPHLVIAATEAMQADATFQAPGGFIRGV